MATVFPASQAIVLGGGLAGVSAANTVLECGGRVVLLDKSSFCGGNSTKATSGINGANTRTQRMQGHFDSNETFVADTLRGGAKKPELAKVLCENSGPDVEWLMDKFDLDLSLVARLGGHSQPRTHRGKERFPGMTITYALIQMLEKIAENTDRAKIVCKAKATKYLTNSRGECVGVEYEIGGKTLQEHGPVIVCTGGFGADFTRDSLLAQHRPDLMHLPTTNGEHCTGDGIKMGMALGAKTIDLEWVQVHPTGLVKPDDADAKVKFLAAEALRGVGGVLLDANGKRFANELGRRDYVTGEMWKNKPPFRLCLNKAASTEIHWHCEHYKGRGVMKYFATGADLAKEIGVPTSVVEQSFREYTEVGYKQVNGAGASPEKGDPSAPYDAYGGGKSWDKFGKKFFHNLPVDVSDSFHVAIVTPVIHYCMGGLEIDVNSLVLGPTGKAIPGLYAAGEIAGGVHGNNRLGGNSLLDCVVFGRVAGRHCAEYMAGEIVPTSLKALAGTNAAKAAAPAAAAPAAPAAPAAAPAAAGYTLEEVAKHTTKDDCWVVVNDQVLNVTKFLPDHPGGELAILTFAGKDATAEFNMIHPGDVIPKYAPDAIIGTLGGGGAAPAAVAAAPAAGGAPAAAAPAAGGYTLEEVAKHTTKDDCWVVVDGKVLNVTKFLPDHPGGELAILTFAGKDATAEFNMIHPPDVVGKYAPDAIIGNLGAAAPAAAVMASAPAATGGAGAPLLEKAADSSGGFLDGFAPASDAPFGCFSSIYSMVFAFLREVIMTIFSTNGIKVTGDRSGLTRSAFFLIFFIVIHAVGNLHVFLGPDDFNGYGYFYVRLYWTGFGFDANIVEEYVLIAAVLHVFVALKRTWDITSSYSITSGKWNLAISGIILLSYMVIHLFQFRFGATDPYKVRPPPYLINIFELPHLFFTTDESVPFVEVRDIYKLEFDIFKSPTMVAYYEAMVFVFLTHYMLGWAKVVPSSQLNIPKKYHWQVTLMGYAIGAFIGLCYLSFPAYAYLVGPSAGVYGQI